MKYRRIADTDLLVSPLGLGTVKFGRNQGVKYPNEFDLPSDKAIDELLGICKEHGVNLLDTAPAYGISEQRLGKILKGQRKDWIIGTKVGEEFVDGESSFHFDAQSVVASIERSMKRLGTDYLDIVQVHSNGDDVEIINRYGILDQLNELKKKGWIRATGMSTKTVEGGILALKNSDLVMATYHRDYQDEKAVLDFCEENNKGCLLKKAFSSGHFTQSETDDESLQGMSDIEKALSFVFAHAGVSSVIAGTINKQHLLENIQAVTRFS